MKDRETEELREAYADELTDAQMKFMFHAQQERERQKKRSARRNSPSTSGI